MKSLFLTVVLFALLLPLKVSAGTSFYLSGLFDRGLGSFAEKPNSPGTLLLHDGGVNVTRKVTTCLSTTTCGPELTSDETIIKIDAGRVYLRNLSTGKENSEAIVFANGNRVILARTIMFTDSLTIQNWEKQPPPGNIGKSYALAKLLSTESGVLLHGSGSTGSIQISADGKSITRSLMICIQECSMPTSGNFEITITPGKKAFFKNKETGAISENYVINADHDAIVLYEKSSGIITVWTPTS